MEDLIDEWKRFNLMDEEKENHITLNPDEIKNINDQLEHCIVRKLLSNRIISATASRMRALGCLESKEQIQH